MAISARIIADSVSPNNDRLTTLECTFHRFILSEFNTHRAFSRNSASSRAIPVSKIIEQVLKNPAIPISFPREQPGMSGGEEVNLRYKAAQRWVDASVQAAEEAMHLVDLKVHKSVVNRLLEPFMWHTVVVSATEWDNFFNQRISEGAQPEIKDLAEKMQSALRASVPQRIGYGGWHLPYVTDAEMDPFRSDLNVEARQALSVARVAGVSYNRLGTIREIQKDLALYVRLRTAEPPHWSPFEHVATPVHPNMIKTANFKGWQQLRHILEEADGNQEADNNDGTM